MATCVLVLVTTARECHHTAARIAGTWRHHHLQGHSEGGRGEGDGGPAQVQAGQGGLRLAAARLLPRLHGRLAAPGHQVSCDWWRRVT